jgi:hypothetical protein
MNIEFCNNAVFIHGAIVSSFEKYFVKDMGFVVIFGHMPFRYVEWNEDILPINKNFKLKGKFRMASYDIQMSTSEFISNIHQFDDHGISLVQLSKPLPNTLIIDGKTDIEIDKILKSNGAILRIYLPHAIETGCVRYYNDKVFSDIIKNAQQGDRPEPVSGHNQ